MNQYPGIYNLAQGNMGLPFVNPALPFNQQSPVPPPQQPYNNLMAQNAMNIPNMQNLMYMNPMNPNVYLGVGALQQQQQQQQQQQMFDHNFLGNILNNPVCAMLMQLRQIEQEEGAQQQQQQQQYQHQCQQYAQQCQQYQQLLEQQQQHLQYQQQQAPLAHPAPAPIPSAAAAAAAAPTPTLSPSVAAPSPSPSPPRPNAAARRNPCFLAGLFDSREEKILREYQNLGFFWVWRLANSGSQFQTFNLPNQKLILKNQKDPVERNRVMLDKEKTLKGNIVLNLSKMTGVCSYSFLGRNEIVELEIKMQNYEDANLQIVLKK